MMLIFSRFTYQIIKEMELQHHYTVEEVLEIVNAMAPKDRETIKTTLLLEEAEFERLVKEDFSKFEATFKALA